MSPPSGGRAAEVRAVLLAGLVGTALRLWQLPGQIVADDEWHALRAATEGSYGWILSHFGEADHSIPLAVLYKLMLATSGLSEITMRLPMLLVGITSLVAFPLLLPDVLGPTVRRLFAWLLALSPLHVYYSRYARPYSLTLFCAFVGALAFSRWRATGERRFGLAYVGLAVAGSYLHLAALPALLGPLLAALVRSKAHAGEPVRPPLKLRIGLAASLALGLAFTLGPPLWSDWASLRDKAGKDMLTLATARDALGLFTGLNEPRLALLIALLAAVGWIALWRTVPTPAACLLFSAGASLAFSVAARPSYVSVPIVFARYNIILLPVVLLSTSVALAGLADRMFDRRRKWVRGLTGATLVVSWAGLGPLRGTYYWPNEWTNHAVFQYTYDATSSNSYIAGLRPRETSAFYLWLARYPRGRFTLLEQPWYLAWHFNTYPFYQRVHRQHTLIGLGDDAYPFTPGRSLLARPGVRLADFLDGLDPALACRRGVDYAVFHKDLATEMARGDAPALDVTPELAAYRDFAGPPDFEDRTLVVFSLGKACKL